jgi:DNA polymerase-3 subunit delta'
MPFRSITGHQRAVMLLARAVANDTLPPSLLLAGPPGVGKRLVALAIAEALNCLKRLERQRTFSDATPELACDACGACSACRRIARGAHPDIIIVEPGDSGSIKIEQIREVVDRAGYRPFEGRRRVVIIDDADAMVPAAQNALLKTLEEPPSASVFVLVSSMPDALLPTVLSRCPRLRFAPLAPADVTLVLQREHHYSDVDAQAVAADAEGSVGRALQSQSASVAAAREIARRMLGEASRAADPVRRLECVKDLAIAKGTPATERDQLAVCLRALSSMLRDLGILSTQADDRLVANVDIKAELLRLASTWDGSRLGRAFAAVDRALGALQRNASPKVVADWVVLQL